MGGARLERAGARLLRPPRRRAARRVADCTASTARRCSGRARRRLRAVSWAAAPSRVAARDGPARMDADRRDRLRRPAGAHRAAAAAGRRAPPLARARASSRTRSPPATCCPGPASTQLAIFCAWRVAGGARRDRRRPRVHRPGGRADPRALGAVPRALAAALGSGRGRRRRRGGRRRGGRTPAAGCSDRAGARARSDARAARALARLRRVGGARRRALSAPTSCSCCSACGAGRAASPRGCAAGAGRTRLDACAAARWPPRRVGGLGALAWVAFKVGALSFGGGFVIVPLMQGDAVHTYHWMTSAQFLNAVALGQVTPGPGGGDGRGRRLRRARRRRRRARRGRRVPPVVLVRADRRPAISSGCAATARAQAFLDGAGPAAIGAILGAAIPLAAALDEAWQFGLLAAAAVALLVATRVGIVADAASPRGVIGGIGALAGGPRRCPQLICLAQRPVSCRAWPEKLTTCWIPVGRFV